MEVSPAPIEMNFDIVFLSWFFTGYWIFHEAGFLSGFYFSFAHFYVPATGSLRLLSVVFTPEKMGSSAIVMFYATDYFCSRSWLIGNISPNPIPKEKTKINILMYRPVKFFCTKWNPTKSNEKPVNPYQSTSVFFRTLCPLLIPFQWKQTSKGIQSKKKNQDNPILPELIGPSLTRRDFIFRLPESGNTPNLFWQW